VKLVGVDFVGANSIANALVLELRRHGDIAHQKYRFALPSRLPRTAPFRCVTGPLFRRTANRCSS
jgi:hypothetical protein